MPIYTTQELYDCSKSLAGGWLAAFRYPWAALAGLADAIVALGEALPADAYREVKHQVWVAVDARVAESASIIGPCIIDSGAEVRHCAFIRGSALVGKGAVVGNSCELKNALLFDKVQVPHFNYVGDSILGHRAHLGAGAITSNVKSDKAPVVVKSQDEAIDTGRKKVGAMVGDDTEVGCNSVLNPGSMLGKNCIVYPTSCLRGVLPHHSIHRQDGTVKPRSG